MKFFNDWTDVLVFVIIILFWLAISIFLEWLDVGTYYKKINELEKRLEESEGNIDEC